MALDRIDVLVDQKPFTWKLVNSLWIAPIIIGMADIKQDCIPELCQVEVAGSVV